MTGSRTITDENKRIIRRQFEELINNKNYEVLQDLAEDFVDHEAPPHQPPGPKGVRMWMDALFSWVPDLEVEILDMISEGDRVVVRNEWHGTHTGPLFGIPPTGRRIRMRGIVIWRLENRRIRERWAILDRWDLEQQLQQERS